MYDDDVLHMYDHPIYIYSVIVFCYRFLPMITGADLGCTRVNTGRLRFHIRIRERTAPTM